MSELDTTHTEIPPSPVPADPEASSRRKAMFIVFLVVFIDLLGFGIVLPLLPLYANRLLGPIYPAEEHRMLHGAVLGVLMASFSFMQFLFAPIYGRISDRVGRRPIILLGLAGSVVFYGLFAYASAIGFGPEGRPGLALVLILIARIGAGIAGATISTAQAVIADCTTPATRARGMALIGAAFGIGFTFGPILCYTSFFIPSKAAPGGTAACLSLVALVLAIALLPETLRTGVEAGRRHWLKFGATREALRMPVVGALILVFFLATLAFGSLESTLALMNQFLLGAGEVARMDQMSDEQLEAIIRKSSLIFAYVGLVLMLIQGFVYRRFVNRVGEGAFLRAGVFLMLAGLGGVIATLLAVARGGLAGESVVIPVALAILAVLVTGFALMTPSVQALISKAADPARQGEILGVNQSMSALARILGPAAGSFLFFVEPSHVMPYVAGAALMVVVLVLTLRLRPK
jgi:DHA1 family tetracycline resistance protein-like MFS transporter